MKSIVIEKPNTLTIERARFRSLRRAKFVLK